ncbi:MAG TPA: 6-carboxytetrahydropterin synthase [Gemmatimonadaceae bacterium]|nr:6-carboxytetrahydropterin synthase [Gemmatimonadaceae bacterium]
MPRASLTRRVTFAAAHRYRRPDWSDAKNHEVFGACANPHYHGHNYACEVTVRGEVDRVTGMVIDLAVLDRVLRDEVVSRFDHRNLNLEVPEFGEGQMIPTGENLALLIAERVRAALAGRVELTRVVVREDESLAAEWTP